ncbi:hypothetical protein Taro_046788, partial [Colocasia esculenta]|nr:hypothetical protein [Colocasia esculenta]
LLCSPCILFLSPDKASLQNTLFSLPRCPFAFAYSVPAGCLLHYPQRQVGGRPPHPPSAMLPVLAPFISCLVLSGYWVPGEMAVTSRGRTLELPRQWRDRETSPERTKVWTEPKPKVPAAAAPAAAERKVPVVYYLSRNGHLEHPHFMEVTLSSADGLYLRDVVNRLNYLRGKGMATMYAWSSKRSYKNGFVWHDLTGDDFIHPVHGHEYVLKGSELLHGLDGSPSSRDTSCTTSATSSSSSDKSLDVPKSYQDDTDSAPPTCKKTPWQSFDLNEYKVYKADSSADATLKAADASTQTDDRRQCRRALVRDDRCRPGDVPKPEEEINPTTELGRDEISPPPSSSSPETLETLIKADVRAGASDRATQDPDQAPGAHHPSGRVRASAVLMHLISCGSLSVKDHGGFSLVSQYRVRLPRGRGPEASDHRPRQPEVAVDRASFPAVSLEDKEYFSGSVIETKKKAAEGAGELASLKRSSSFNADSHMVPSPIKKRAHGEGYGAPPCILCWPLFDSTPSSKLDLAEKEVDGVRAKCIPRRPSKASIARRDGGNKGSSSARSTDGAKQPSEPRT